MAGSLQVAGIQVGSTGGSGSLHEAHAAAQQQPGAATEDSAASSTAPGKRKVPSASEPALSSGAGASCASLSSNASNRCGARSQLPLPPVTAPTFKRDDAVLYRMPSGEPVPVQIVSIDYEARPPSYTILYNGVHYHAEVDCLLPIEVDTPSKAKRSCSDARTPSQAPSGPSACTSSGESRALAEPTSTQAVHEPRAVGMDDMVASIRRLDHKLDVRPMSCQNDVAAFVRMAHGTTTPLGRTVFIACSTTDTGLYYSALLADANSVRYFEEPTSNGATCASRQQLLIQLRIMLHSVPLFGDEPIPNEPGVVPCTLPPLEARVHAAPTCACAVLTCMVRAHVG